MIAPAARAPIETKPPALQLEPRPLPEELNAGLDGSAPQAPALKASLREQFDKDVMTRRIARLDEQIAAATQRNAETLPRLQALYDRVARAPVEPETAVTGAEAERIWKLAEEHAREFERSTGRSSMFPPAGDVNYGFISDGYQYNLRGDGTITKHREGVPTSEAGRAQTLESIRGMMDFVTRHLDTMVANRDAIAAALRDGKPYASVELSV